MSNHPIYLTSDECVFALLNNFDEKGRRGTLRVELKEKEGGCVFFLNVVKQNKYLFSFKLL